MQAIPALTAAAEVAGAIAQVELQLTSAFGLNLPEALTLCAVAGEQLPATAVSDRTHLRPSHLSKVIAAMRRRNLLTTTRTKADRRLRLLSLTEAGTELVATLRAHPFLIPPLLRPLSKHLQKG